MYYKVPAEDLLWLEKCAYKLGILEEDDMPEDLSDGSDLIGMPGDEEIIEAINNNYEIVE